jgi:hypothetical protein
MAIIDDLKDSISSMTDEQLMDLVMSIRANRRIRKEKPNKRKSKSNIVDLTKLVSKISPEAAKVLLAQLNKKKG